MFDTKRQPTMPAIKLSLRIDGMFHTMEVDTGAALTLISEGIIKYCGLTNPTNHPKWTQGTVEKSLGEWMYEVTNKDGRRQRRHVDQLRQASESLQTGKQQYSPREQYMPVQLFWWEDTPVQQEPDQDQPPLLEQHREMIPQREKSWEPGQTSATRTRPGPAPIVGTTP
uniref:Uncharacterized protein n=1 Tax=Timema genevievae TaxID=629358 RepID=A0A7R9JTC0_TIMGE|nr:unnamed protein product [Timema genevievae]